MSDGRADPERLLAAARREEASRGRGRLKVFLGAAAGVGKTCSMLAAAHEARAAGRDVVVGVVDTHGRPDTEARLRGLPVLPRRVVAGYPLGELDLDAALARRPHVLVVDELAHTNAPGSRHPKRWHDVRELVDAGLEVWTAVNVQHLEGVNDVVARLTGVTVRETVPDALLDDADEVEVVDLPPGELLERLEAGKIYPPGTAERALRAFFREGNLIALRQLALRRAAERVGAQLDDYRDEVAMPEVWAAGERVLVAVGPSPLSERLVRVAARLARRLDAEWHAVTIQAPTLRERAGQQALAHLRLAERLGAETAVLTGDDVAQALVAYARRVNATTVVLGASPGGLLARSRGSLVDRVVALARDVHVHIVPSEGYVRRPPPADGPPAWQGLGIGVFTVSLATALAWVVRDRLPESDIIMLYLVGVTVAAFRLPRVASLLTALASVAAFNFFFTEPRFTFYVHEARYLVTFTTMAITGVVISHLAGRARERARVAQEREARTRVLHAFTRGLVTRTTPDDVAALLAEQIHAALGVGVSVRLRDGDGLAVAARAGEVPTGDVETGTAEWAATHARAAGAGTDTLPAARARYLPLGTAPARGVVGIVPIAEARLDDPERRHLLETLVDQGAQALDRLALAGAALAEGARADVEQARSALLSSVSHDLRTPLAVITAAADTLEVPPPGLDDAGRHELASRIASEARRLEGRIGNLLQMTRLEGGALEPDLDWHVADELVGAAVARVSALAGARPITVSGPDDVTLARVDGALVEQLLVNYLENALAHAPDGPIEVAIRADADTLTLEVRDRGPGLPPDVDRLFDRFERRPGSPGIGLGLSIARAIATVHGGTAWARPRDGGGAVFGVNLPRGVEPPRIDP